jgi:formylglycine-generating enzyme required for sulfatase activity
VRRPKGPQGFSAKENIMRNVLFALAFALCAAAAFGQNAPAPAGMVWVEGGTFLMGSTGGDDDEGPVHAVTVRGFYMGEYQVTQGEWRDVMGSSPSRFKGDPLPVEQVSWFEAVEYCNKRSVREGLVPAYGGSGENITCDFDAPGYRLPTEAEWEYAARGGNKDPAGYEYAGSGSPGDVAWYTGNSGRQTHQVGTKQPNGLGLYDMSGNVYEWCWDRYGNYSGDLQTDPRGPSTGDDRVMRGGSWNGSARGVRLAYRNRDAPSYRNRGIGFRVARSAL